MDNISYLPEIEPEAGKDFYSLIGCVYITGIKDQGIWVTRARNYIASVIQRNIFIKRIEWSRYNIIFC